MRNKRSFPHKAPEHGHIPGQHKSMTRHQGEAVCVMSWCWCRIEYLRWAQCLVQAAAVWADHQRRGGMLSASHRHHGGIAILWGICCLLFSTFPGTAAPIAMNWLSSDRDTVFNNVLSHWFLFVMMSSLQLTMHPCQVSPWPEHQSDYAPVSPPVTPHFQHELCMWASVEWGQSGDTDNWAR